LAGGGTVADGRQIVPEAIDQYPEVKTFGPWVPAYGIWARHVKGLKLINVKFNLSGSDLRPALVCEDGSDLEVSNWNLPDTEGGESIIRLENIKTALVKNVTVKGTTKALVRVEGTASTNVKVFGNKLSGISKELEIIKK
jgi:hypothetical protein